MTKFENAQELHKANPNSFQVPTQEELDGLTKGDTVKVNTCGERFWVIVTWVGGESVIGTVDNDLLFTDEHGLDYGDIITFTKENIYDIFN